MVSYDGYVNMRPCLYMFWLFMECIYEVDFSKTVLFDENVAEQLIVAQQCMLLS